MEESFKKLDRIIIFFLVYTMIFLIFFGTLKYTFPFVIALIFALILKRPTEYLIKKLKINNTFSCLITNIIFFSIIFLLLFWGISIISREIAQFAKNIQSYIVNNSDKIYELMENIQNRYNNINPELLNSIKNHASGVISKYSGNIMDLSTSLVSFTLGFVSNFPYIIMVVFFTIITTYFFTKDLSVETGVMNFTRFKGGRASNIYNEAKKKLLNYGLSYLVIIFLTFIETLIVFTVLDIKYALILSIISGIADILPVLGIGAIYTPLVIIYWLTGNKFTAIALIISYAIISAIRQIVEPKLVSSSLGIHPVAVLAAIFIGLKVNGIMGMMYFMFLVVFYNLLEQVGVL
ncbi:sporulation integral membrane protein YtvI [Hathewaya massiliensis]|uniref:sporulation integral membrane protein YtvI n=1 Tax=Hathewaya massiliensis TaxID=1964382 RepID=UPI001158D53A|nr:sporulation integral membrane protein YtvI [Hathewaya massiliensis]